jgi:predicted signal transduction protein with EAL and GGDEF domain
VDVLKVDRSFVAGLGGATPAGAGTGSAPSVALAHAVIALGRTLSLRTVAEGVETEPQRAQLQALGCEYGQGYLFARPVAADEVRALFHAPPLPAADAATGTATGDTAAGGTAAGGTASGDAAAGDTPADGGPAGSGRTLVTA